jgi:hypothetical protein
MPLGWNLARHALSVKGPGIDIECHRMGSESCHVYCHQTKPRRPWRAPRGGGGGGPRRPAPPGGCEWPVAPRPPLGMSWDSGIMALCARAIIRSPTGRMRLAELYAWIQKHCRDIEVWRGLRGPPLCHVALVNHHWLLHGLLVLCRRGPRRNGNLRCGTLSVSTRRSQESLRRPRPTLRTRPRTSPRRPRPRV